MLDLVTSVTTHQCYRLYHCRKIGGERRERGRSRVVLFSSYYVS